MSKFNAAKTHCKRGHEFTPENTEFSQGARQCIACRRARVTAQDRKRGVLPKEQRDALARHHRQRVFEFPSAGTNLVSRASKRRAIDKLRTWVNLQKQRPCTDCKGTFNPWVMDFDHLEGKKKVAGISQLVQQAKSKKVIEEEMAKCELVCANCHRERTHRRRTGAG